MQHTSVVAECSRRGIRRKGDGKGRERRDSQRSGLCGGGEAGEDDAVAVFWAAEGLRGVRAEGG